LWPFSFVSYFWRYKYLFLLRIFITIFSALVRACANPELVAPGAIFFSPLKMPFRGYSILSVISGVTNLFIFLRDFMAGFSSLVRYFIRSPGG
jgi:hypothetical protein